MTSAQGEQAPEHRVNPQIRVGLAPAILQTPFASIGGNRPNTERNSYGKTKC